MTIGIYLYSSTNGHPIELYRWILTIGFGVIFFIGSLPDEK